MAEQKKAEGSVWNPNSWHWENKNYSEITKELITDKIMSVQLCKDDIIVKMDKIDSIKGHAELSIRKGKQIFVFSYEAEVTFKGENPEHEITGSYKLHDINESPDLDYEILNIAMNDKNQISDTVKELVRKFLKKELDAKFSTIRDEIMQIEANRQEQVKQKKLEEQQKLQDVREQKQQSNNQ